MKSMELGGGGRFAQMKRSTMKTGKSEKDASAITASAGRKKYGKKKMSTWAAAGRKRAAERKEK